ncbi:exonuclease domain-containing protein [Salegentibacter salegens]|uniref:DNA polymerase-3 subunit epsilon n=1 Tax=Salegentibacter salegens TaxID=143223 RepID=A0A1M7K003_9FLAO|nr:exonuclease domain-containing protein [Salegentibacter salegens]PRX42984.1 DNA polymerase-3 subunit epsilon [Salegentibacter salegens]SHM58662.1 DNA polymerase-3 subunit epsilon [Salegentibacter salegens]
MYAVVDIETTGGKYNEEGITEIAIYKFDGLKVIDQFISLVNPEKPIQPFVVNLTGINNDMLRNAPKFYEVAKRIVEITSDCVLVAHNAKFDYRILRTEFKRLGFEFERKSLCTVELSKKLIPGQASYSLGKLVRALGIPLSDRHRASGDAQATVKLFKMLLAKDIEKNILKDAVKLEPKRQIDTRLVYILEDLPGITGVYYFHNEEGEIIYIGKSRNIKKRVTQHFTNEQRKAREMQKEVNSVSFEATGNELAALLKENQEIKHNKPKYNKVLKKNIFSHALYHSVDENGYINLKIGRAGKKHSITTFSSLKRARNVMEMWIEKYELCHKLCNLEKGNGNCFNYTLKKCHGACINEESVESYNERVRELIDKHSYKNQHMLVIDRGREIDEKSALLVEDGQFKGIGYFNLNHQISNIDIIRSIITPMKNDRDAQHIIQSYLRRNSRLKIVPLTPQTK